jgi:hypothetical protein
MENGEEVAVNKTSLEQDLLMKAHATNPAMVHPIPHQAAKQLTRYCL